MQHVPVRRGIAVLALAALAACDAGPTAVLPDRVQQSVDYARQVEAMGFRSEGMQDFGDHVLVEGDIMLAKARLRTSDPMGPRYQYRTTNLASSGNVHSVVVNLSGLASEPGWQAAAVDALAHWSGITGSHVRLTQGTSSVDITVATNCTYSNVAAAASFPAGGNVGPTVYVNTCFGYSTTHAQKVHNMVHEFGHTLGFRHSNYTQMGEGSGAEGAVHIWNTPTSGNDPGSVMNGGTALNAWAGFSSSDLYAVRALYPAVLSPTVTYPGGTPSVAWNAINGATFYTVYHVTDRYYVGPGTSERVEQVVGTATGTSLSDPSQSYTGSSMCEIRGTVQGGIEEQYGYRVEAHWPNGTTYSAVVPAETGNC